VVLEKPITLTAPKRSAPAVTGAKVHAKGAPLRASHVAPETVTVSRKAPATNGHNMLDRPWLAKLSIKLTPRNP